MKNVKNRFVGNKISKTSKKYIPSFIFYNKKNNVTLPLNTSALYTRDPKALAFLVNITGLPINSFRCYTTKQLMNSPWNY